MEVALLASGGVDSAVAAHLLCERGEKPHLFYIKIGADEESEFSCTMEEDLEMVNLLAHQYGLQVDVVDLHADYWSRVISYLIDRVKRGLTPNPDVMCNSLIKFGCFYDKVGQYFDQTITGHYATTVMWNGVKHLATALDPVKDQTDFLCQISPEQLANLDFPVGHLMKHEVRAIADRMKLPPAQRRDSQGICFLGNTTYNVLLKHYLGERPGQIIEWETGTKLGEHPGYWYFTIGQRKGLRLGGGPWFVVHKDTRRNRVYVSRGAAEELLCHELRLADFHTIATPELDHEPQGEKVCFKIRHSPEFESGAFSATDEGYVLTPDRPLRGVAPGQFAVVYCPLEDGRKVCWGSGEIVLSTNRARRPAKMDGTTPQK